MDRVEIGVIVGVDQGADGNHDIPRADVIASKGVFALSVEHGGYVLVFVDHLHRHESAAGVRQRYVTGPASRSKTPAEYRVSRFERTTSCLSIGVSSRFWANLPNPPSFTTLPKYRSLSALVKLSGETSTAPSD